MLTCSMPAYSRVDTGPSPAPQMKIAFLSETFYAPNQVIVATESCPEFSPHLRDAFNEEFPTLRCSLLTDSEENPLEEMCAQKTFQHYIFVVTCDSARVMLLRYFSRHLPLLTQHRGTFHAVLACAALTRLQIRDFSVYLPYRPVRFRTAKATKEMIQEEIVALLHLGARVSGPTTGEGRLKRSEQSMKSRHFTELVSETRIESVTFEEVDWDDGEEDGKFVSDELVKCIDDDLMNLRIDLGTQMRRKSRSSSTTDSSKNTKNGSDVQEAPIEIIFCPKTEAGTVGEADGKSESHEPTRYLQDDFVDWTIGEGTRRRKTSGSSSTTDSIKDTRNGGAVQEAPVIKESCPKAAEAGPPGENDAKIGSNEPAKCLQEDLVDLAVGFETRRRRTSGSSSTRDSIKDSRNEGETQEVHIHSATFSMDTESFLIPATFLESPIVEVLSSPLSVQPQESVEESFRTRTSSDTSSLDLLDENVEKRLLATAASVWESTRGSEDLQSPTLQTTPHVECRSRPEVPRRRPLRYLCLVSLLLVLLGALLACLFLLEVLPKDEVLGPWFWALLDMAL